MFRISFKSNSEIAYVITRRIKNLQYSRTFPKLRTFSYSNIMTPTPL